MSDGEDGRGRARIEVEFGQQVGDVAADRAWAERQGFGDLAITQARDQQAKDLGFARLRFIASIGATDGVAVSAVSTREQVAMATATPSASDIRAPSVQARSNAAGVIALRAASTPSS